jgi:hypothetical protein
MKACNLPGNPNDEFGLMTLLHQVLCVGCHQMLIISVELYSKFGLIDHRKHCLFHGTMGS